MITGKPPEWFKEVIGYAQREDHYTKVDGYPWLGRLVHWFARCPACKYRKDGKHER